MSRKRNAVCAVEFGTSKVCALIAEVGGRGEVGSVIGFGVAHTPGAVIKGEIADMVRASKALGKALEDADRSSGGELVNCPLLTVLVSGCGIESRQANGIVTVKNPDGVITEADKLEAGDNAKIVSLGAGREIINTSVSHYLVDNRRVSNPLRQSGRRLEACVHIIHGISGRLNNFRDAVIDAGVENARIELVFSPLASGIGIVSDLERENGSLLVDLGAGTTEYLVHFDRGVCASGVIQLGMEHVANDLSVGLNLNIDVCRKLLESGTLEAAILESRQNDDAKSDRILELPGVNGKVRRIPLASFEEIVDARLREIFDVVSRQLREKDSPRSLGAGGILTGGGANFFRSRELFRDVFGMDCRIGLPTDPGAAAADLASPRFSALWGALRVAAFFRENYGPAPESILSKVVTRVSRVFGHGGR